MGPGEFVLGPGSINFRLWVFQEPCYSVRAVCRAPLVLSLSFVFLLSSLALADDANWSTFGGAGAFTRNRHVRMEREDVRITMLDEKVKVHATFWFRNRGAARSVRMGFPDETRLFHDTKRGVLYGFRSTVDGEPVRVARQQVKRGHHPGWDVDAYRSAWVKTVRFPRNGARKVEVWYSAHHGYAGSGWAFDTYVFRTGATWRGTIGRIATTVDWSKMRTRSRPMLTLTAPTRGARWTYPTAHSAHLEVRNVEPKFDLDLTTIDGFWNFRLNGRRLEQNLGLEKSISGPPQDLRVSAESFGYLFGRYLENKGGNTEWASPVSRRFGKRLELVGRQTLVTGDGRRLRLKHPATDELGKPLGKGEEPYVRLRDVFRALGGSYAYVPRMERVDLWLGRRSSKRRSAVR
jgi:hypothetical protein